MSEFPLVMVTLEMKLWFTNKPPFTSLKKFFNDALLVVNFKFIKLFSYIELKSYVASSPGPARKIGKRAQSHLQNSPYVLSQQSLFGVKFLTTRKQDQLKK